MTTPQADALRPKRTSEFCGLALSGTATENEDALKEPTEGKLGLARCGEIGTKY